VGATSRFGNREGKGLASNISGIGGRIHTFWLCVNLLKFESQEIPSVQKFGGVVGLRLRLGGRFGQRKAHELIASWASETGEGPLRPGRGVQGDTFDMIAHHHHHTAARDGYYHPGGDYYGPAPSHQPPTGPYFYGSSAQSGHHASTGGYTPGSSPRHPSNVSHPGVRPFRLTNTTTKPSTTMITRLILPL
jgi:hypothetical protein